MNNTQTTGKKFFPTTHRAEVNSYPYGRLKATAFFGLEFKRGKGFRTTFQTINPKNGKLNAIKNSTYSPIFVMYEEQETGHIKYLSFDLYGEEGINKAAEFMRDNYDLFTAEQIQDICGSIFVHLKAGAKAICVYCGADFEKVKPILDPAVNAVVEGIKTGANVFDRVKIDIDALNSCKVEGYNPFKVTTYQMA
jgi:hypothetical protein